MDVLSVTRVEVDSARMRALKDEHGFVGLAVELLVEVGSYLSIAANVLPSPDHRWSRHEAVLIGHLARLFKLISALLDQTCQHRRETTFIFARLAFECIVNTNFLIRNEESEIVTSYIEYSMRHEKRLRDRIRANVAARNGKALPIEERMLRSIEESAKRSGVDLDSINPSSSWGGKNLFEKAKDVGLDEAYLGAFAGPSHSVHGNWQDLLEYHLCSEGDGFTANLEWHQPRPQLLSTIAQLTVHTLEGFFSEFVGKPADSLFNKLGDLRDRIGTFVHLHEEYLARQ